MTKLEQKQFNLNILKKCRASYWVSAAVVLGLVLLKLVLVNRAATWGRQLELMQAETQTVLQANDALRLKLNQQSGGLEALRIKAAERGFLTEQEYVYFSPSERVAQKLP